MTTIKENKQGMYDTVMQQFHATADEMELNPNIRRILAIFEKSQRIFPSLAEAQSSSNF